MRTEHAVRNIRLCTKDCLCLFVCPVGATNTENGQVDWEKCTGCGVCAKACPSGAISMIPDILPPQQKKNEEVLRKLRALAKSKTEQEAIASGIAKNTQDPLKSKLANALAHSNRLMAEDILRECEFMLPQSGNALSFLKSLLNEPRANFPSEIACELLKSLKAND